MQKAQVPFCCPEPSTDLVLDALPLPQVAAQAHVHHRPNEGRPQGACAQRARSSPNGCLRERPGTADRYQLLLTPTTVLTPFQHSSLVPFHQGLLLVLQVRVGQAWNISVH